MRTLDRMVLGSFFKLFAVVVVAVPPLFILSDFTERADTYLDRGLTRVEIGQAYLYKLAEFAWFSFPIAALVASVFTVYNMTRHREVVAAKAGGISFHRLIAPLLLAGVAMMGATFGLSWLVPRGNAIAAQIQRDEARGRTWRSDFVYRSEGGIDWQVQRLTVEGRNMRGIVLERPVDEAHAGLHVTAEGATWSEEEGWVLVEGYLRRLEADSTEHAIRFARMAMPELKEKPEDLLERPRDPEEMTISELDRIITVLDRSGGDPKEYRVWRGQLLALPVATLVIVLFGASLATSYKRGGAAFGVGLSLLTVIAFIAITKFAQALGEAGAISAWAAAWTPNVVFGTAGLGLLARVRT